MHSWMDSTYGSCNVLRLDWDSLYSVLPEGKLGKDLEENYPDDERARK